MKKPIRVIFNALAVLSSLLCMAAIGMMVWSRHEITRLLAPLPRQNQSGNINNSYYIIHDSHVSVLGCELSRVTVIILTAILPTCWIADWIFHKLSSRRPSNSSHCSSCGYDLRATPDRCPECGTVPARG